jgi:prepilin-type processing-associated H-X9-DG protein
MDTLTSLDEEILYIFDEPEPARAPRRRWDIAGVIGLAAAVALALVIVVAVVPAVREYRRKQCHEHLRSIGRALHEYEAVQRHFPAPALADRDGTPLLSWRVALLPQLGYQSLYERFHLDEPWDSPHNRALLAEMPPEFACPAGPGPRAGRTGYLVVVGPKTEVGSTNTPFEPTRGADIQEFFDGTSNTAVVLETDVLVPWTKPEDLRWAPGGPLPQLTSPHAGGAHVLLADGSARFLKSTIDSHILLGLLTINGGEVLSGG